MLAQYSSLLAKGRAVLALVALVVIAGGFAQAAPVGYQFDVTTNYAYVPGNPGGPPFIPAGAFFIPGPTSNDTGYVTVTNNGASTFTGTINLSGIAGNGNSANNVNETTPTVTLAPGQSVIVAVNDSTGGLDSSNVGGFNFNGTNDNGLLITLNGDVSHGAASELVNLMVNDSQFSTGWVLQGGDPFGGDTGDAFETSQTPGHFSFVEAAATVPEPATMLLFGMGLTGLAAFSRRWRKARPQ